MAHLVILVASGHMEIRPQAGILLQPELVVGLNPVNLAVLKGKEGHSSVHLVIIRQVRHKVVFRQSLLEPFVQIIIGAVTDTQHIHAVLVQTVAEIPIMLGKMGRDKHKIHQQLASSSFSFNR